MTSSTSDDGSASLPRTSYVVGRLDRALRRELDHLLEPFGLTRNQYTALSVLRRSAGLSNAQLARRSYVTPQSMLAVIAALEAAGHIERAPSTSHRGVLLTRLTKRGQHKLKACDRAVDEMEQQMLADIPQERRSTLVAELMSCVRALHAGFAERETSLS
jgi:DNA-binding MarR family transcriptional regulator